MQLGQNAGMKACYELHLKEVSSVLTRHGNLMSKVLTSGQSGDMERREVFMLMLMFMFISQAL